MDEEVNLNKYDESTCMSKHDEITIYLHTNIINISRIQFQYQTTAQECLLSSAHPA